MIKIEKKNEKAFLITISVLMVPFLSSFKWNPCAVSTPAVNYINHVNQFDTTVHDTYLDK